MHHDIPPHNTDMTAYDDSQQLNMPLKRNANKYVSLQRKNLQLYEFGDHISALIAIRLWKSQDT